MGASRSVGVVLTSGVLDGSVVGCGVLTWESGGLTWKSGALTWESGALTWESFALTWELFALAWESFALAWESFAFIEFLVLADTCLSARI